jgi:hypothetical protein
MCGLCKFFHHYHDGIRLPCCSGQFGDEIYSNYFPFPFKMEMVVAILLDVCAQPLPSNILGIWLCSHRIFLHSRPKILASYCYNCLLVPSINKIWYIVHIFKHYISQFLSVRNIKIIPKQKDSIIFLRVFFKLQRYISLLQTFCNLCIMLI